MVVRSFTAFGRLEEENNPYPACLREPGSRRGQHQHQSPKVFLYGAGGTYYLHDLRRLCDCLGRSWHDSGAPVG